MPPQARTIIQFASFSGTLMLIGTTIGSFLLSCDIVTGSILSGVFTVVIAGTYVTIAVHEHRVFRRLAEKKQFSRVLAPVERKGQAGRAKATRAQRVYRGILSSEEKELKKEEKLMSRQIKEAKAKERKEHERELVETAELIGMQAELIQSELDIAKVLPPVEEQVQIPRKPVLPDGSPRQII